MIEKINSTSFKGTIWVDAGDSRRCSGGKSHIFNISQQAIDTDKINEIAQNGDHTAIYMFRDEPKAYSDLCYYIPAKVASTADILAAYAAAKNCRLSVVLNNKLPK